MSADADPIEDENQKVDEWNPPDCNPIKDCMSGLTAMGYSECEAEIFLECLMGKREYNMDLHFDFMTGKLRRSLEKKDQGGGDNDHK